MFRTLFLSLFFVWTMALSAQDNVFLDRSFWKANPSIEAVETAIAAGNDITELNSNMFDAGCYALLEDVDNETIKHVLAKKGNAVDKITHDGRTYMFWAAYRGNLDMMHWLADRGAKCNIEDAHGNSVLNFAANAGQKDIKLYEFLLKHEADINATTRSGANALLLVSSAATNFDIINYFIGKGLSIESVDSAGNGIFQYAAKGGNLDFLKALAAKGAATDMVNSNGENALFMAARATRSKQNDKAVFDYLESLGLKSTVITANGNNLLHYLAGRNKNVSLYGHLLGKGLDAGLANKEGLTPLMIAARGNDLAIVKLLTENSSDINTQDEKGRSALAMAVSRNDVATVDYLLSKGADHKVVDVKGNSLAYYLMQSYNAKNPDAFEAKWASLNKVGLALNVPQHGGNTPLHLAAKDNNLALLKRLSSFTMDVNQKNDEGNTPLHLAAMSTGNAEVLKYLVSKGADVSLKTEFEETVYDLASENELLQEQKVELDFLKSK